MPLSFKKLMSARFLFTLAVQMQAIVLGWQMYSLTHDPLFLGFIGLAEAVPALGLAMYAGYVVDRSDSPLRVYRNVLLVSLASALLLLLTQSTWMNLVDHARVIALFGSSFLTGTARAFSQPSMFAIVPRLIPRRELARSSAWMSSAMQIAGISGPAIGGLVFGYFGVSVTAALVCVVLMGALLALTLIRLAADSRPPRERSASVRTELLSGAVFVLRHPLMFPALSLDMISVLFGGVTSLLPIFASEILHTGPRGLGFLRAAPAVGAAVMGLVLMRIDLKRAGPRLLTAVAGFGGCILVFSLSRNFYLSMAALALSGVFDSVSMVVRTSLVQLSSPDSMRGRISAVNSMFIGSSNELGELESGVAARLLGVVPAAVLGGCVCLLTVAAVALASPALRSLDLEKLKADHDLGKG